MPISRPLADFECVCARDRKIPEREKTFLIDQRILREVAIGGVDAAGSKKTAIVEERKSRFQLFQIKQQKSQDDELLDPETYMISTSESSTNHESDTAEDPDYLETPCHHLKGIHSRSDTNRICAEGLSFYYPRLLHCLNQMLAVVLLSQHQVSSMAGFF